MGTKYLMLFTLLGIFIAGKSRVEAIYVQYKPGYEYLYKFHTNADLNRVGEFIYSGKIGFVPIDDNENGQELLLRVYMLQMQRKGEAPIQERGMDFSKWFSFVINQQGEILHVYFPKTENEEVMALKKAFASLISGKFHHIDHQSVQKYKGGKYGYETEETGHEGPHNATYTVEPDDTGLKFTKVRNGHVMPTAESDYTKTVHYHEGLGLIHKVKVKENVEVAKTPENFNPFEGQRPVKAVNTFTTLRWPKFSAVSEGEALFVVRNKLSQKIKKPKIDLLKDSIHVTDIKKAIKYAQNATELFEYIYRNLTCMRNANAFTKGIDGISCFRSIIRMVEVLPDESLVKLAKKIFHKKLIFRPKDQANAKNMIDVLMAVDTDLALGVLLNMIFKSEVPNKELIHRLLEQFAGRDKPPIQEFITAIEHFVFNPELYPATLMEGGTIHRATLALGSISHSLLKNDLYDQARRIVGKLEKKLGMHDPWADRQKRSILNEYEEEAYELHQVVLLDALGNAALDSSWHHIISYINSSSSIWLRKTGVHSLRKYNHEDAAMRMLESALKDESDVVRYEAGLTFQAHPKAQHHLLKDGPGPRNASKKVYEKTDDGQLIESDQRLSRNKRFLPFTFNIEFHLHSPSYEWRKLLGSTDVGASFGLIIKNNLDLKIQPLEGSLKVEVHDEAYATIHLGIMGLNIDYMKIRVCFIGGAGYNLNFLQDFSFEKINEQLKRYEQLMTSVVSNLETGINRLAGLFSGDLDSGGVINAFVDQLEAIPGNLVNIAKFAHNLMHLIGQLDVNTLPGWTRPISHIAVRAANLMCDIENDVLNFYNTLVEAVTISLPRSIEMIYDSVIKIVNAFEDFFDAPGHAIVTIFSNVLQVQLGVVTMVETMQELKNASFFLAGNRPYWWNLKPIVTDLSTQLVKELSVLKNKSTSWVTYNPFSKAKSQDPVYQVTKGNLSITDLKQKVVSDFLEKCLVGVTDEFDPLIDTIAPFLTAMDSAVTLLTEIKDAYNKLEQGYNTAKMYIDRVFGPKFHKKFPKLQRVAGKECLGTGFYPATMNKTGVEEHRLLGIDLTVSNDVNVVAPRGGSIMLTSYSNEVVIKTGGFNGYEFYIANIVPNTTIKHPSSWTYSKTDVKPGQVIGKSMNPFKHCNNHIHVAVQKGGYIIDPTKFIPKPLIELPKWVSECDDYKVVYKADVKASGSVIGKAGQVAKSLLPSRTNSKPSSSVDTSTAKSPTSTKQATEKGNPDSVSNKLKAVEEEETNAASSSTSSSTSSSSSSSTAVCESGDTLSNGKCTASQTLGFPAFSPGKMMKWGVFKIKNLKIGAIVDFLEKLGLPDTKEELRKVFVAIKDLVNNRRCSNPEQMTDQELRLELIDRGLNSTGSRAIMTKTFKSQDPQCPLIQMTLPKEIYCVMDPLCMGVQCCMELGVSMFKFSVKAWARLNPCEFKLMFGIQASVYGWTKTFDLKNIFFGGDFNLPTGISFDVLPNVELRAMITIQKTDKNSELSFGVMLCYKDDPDTCWSPQMLMENSVFGLPVCNPDGSMTWPDGDAVVWGDFLSRDSIKKRISAAGKQEAKEETEAKAKAVVEELGLPEELLDPTPPCARPSSLTNTIMDTTLSDQGLDITGTRSEKDERLLTSDFSCSANGKDFTLATLSTEEFNRYYYSVSNECRRLDVCFDVPLTNVTKAFRAYIDLDSCNYEFRVGFEGYEESYVTFVYAWGVQHSFTVGDKTHVYYTIDKNEDSKEFIVDLSVDICTIQQQNQTSTTASPDESTAAPTIVKDCIAEFTFLTSVAIPMQDCGSEFTLPGNNSVAGFLSEMGGVLTDNAFDVILITNGLQDILPVGVCTVPSSPSSCSQTFDQSHNASNLSCSLTDSCFGVICCLDLPFSIPDAGNMVNRSVAVSFDIEPCDFTINITVGALWTHHTNLISYDWGQPVAVEIGTKTSESSDVPVALTYTIDKDSTDFYITFDVLFCLNVDDNKVCVPENDPITLIRRMKVPLCDPISLDAVNADTTIRSWMTKMGITDGQLLKEAGIDQFLQETHLIKNVNAEQCDILRSPYDSVVDGWKNDCPSGFYQLSILSDNIRCHIQDVCSGISCCFDVDFHGIYKRALSMEFVVDTCNYIISGSLERFNFTYSLFAYDWGVEDSFDLMDLFKVTYTLNKITNKNAYLMTMKLSVCLDPGQPCQEEYQLLKNTEVPQATCDMSLPITLPNGDTLRQFYDAEAPMSTEALEAALRSLGLGHIISATGTVCPESNNPVDEVCPDSSIALPSGQPSGTTCQLNYQCFGVECCSSIDLGILSSVFKTWFIIDPCQYRLSLGFEYFNFNTTLFAFERNVERKIDVAAGSPSPLALIYSIDKNATNFKLNLKVDIDIPDFTTIELVLFNNYTFPIPNCDINSSFEWPGGSLAQAAVDIDGTPTEYADEAVLRATDLYWIVKGDMCEINSNRTQAELGSKCRHLTMPSLPNYVQCHYDDLCMGLICCLNVDYKLLTKPMKIWSVVDSCSDKVSVGLETYQYNITLGSSFWNRENLLEISDYVRAFFSVSKDDSDMLLYTLVLSIYLDDDNTYPLLDKVEMPSPVCNTDFSLGTNLGSFTSSFPADTMMGATDDILQRLGLVSSFFDTGTCSVADDFVQQSHTNCPDFTFPTMPEGLRCSLNSDCLTVDCCATMHYFDKLQYTFKAKLEILPCSYEVKVTVEAEQVTRNIFENFGSIWSQSYGNAIQVMHKFTSGTPGQLIVDFGLQYCMDGVCSDPLLFMDSAIMTVPMCQGSILTWPSLDYKASMIGYAADAAEKLLSLQNNLLRDELTCNLTVSTTSCPHFELPTLPENYRCAYSRECTGFDCCIDVDMKVSSRTFQFHVLLDPCKFTFSVGFEKWEYNGTLKDYDWGTEVSNDIDSSIHLNYTIKRQNSGKKFNVGASLHFDADAFGLVIPSVGFASLVMPVPQCDYDNNLISWPQDAIKNPASGFVLSQLGIDPSLIKSTGCSVLSEDSNDLQSRCPHFSMGTLPADVSCSFSDMCTGMECCAELDLGIISRTFKVWVQIDPCSFLLSVGFENWNLNVTLIGFSQGQEKTEQIGKGLSLKYKISQSVDRRDFYISLSVVVCHQQDGACQPDIVIFTEASVPVPYCNSDGTFAWPSFDSVDVNGELVQPESAIVLNRLGAPEEALLATECSAPTAVNPANCQGYSMPALPGSVKCAFTDHCTGVTCCASMDLKITQRSFKIWFNINPCDYTLSVGFERVFRNLTMISFKFNQEAEIKVGDNAKMYYTLDRIASSNKYILSMRYEICLDSACENTVILSNVKLGAPFCNADGSLSWPTNTYGNLLPNIIGTEVTLLKNPSCNYNNLEAGTTCVDHQLPNFGKEYCKMDANCNKIACCFPSDLIVETKNLYFYFKIEHCNRIMEYGFERKKYTKSLTGFQFATTQVEQIGTAIKLSYIVRDNGGRYQVRAEIETCFTDNWEGDQTCQTRVLLAQTYYKKKSCGKRKRRSLSHGRVRRNAFISRRLDDSQTGNKAQEQILAAAVNSGKSNEEIALMFGVKMETTSTKSLTTQNKTQPANPTIFQRAQNILMGKGPASHQKPKTLSDKTIPDTISGAAKCIEMLGDGSDKDDATPSTSTFLFGNGLTANGLHVLGIQLANMSSGDMEVFLQMARLDPIQIMQLSITMKDLFVTLYNEMIEVFTNPDKLKEFANDDMTLKGQFPMPKTSVVFFSKTMYFLVGMIIPMTFSFGAEGYYGADCELGLKVLQMSAYAEVTPYTGIMVYGELGIGALLYGKLRLEGYICELRFPTYAEIWFLKFPFDVAMKMDLEIIPLSLKLIALVTLEVDLMFATIKKTLFSANLWEYTTPTIRTNIFSVSTKDEDTSPPEFAGKDSPSGKRSAETSSCDVAQLSGRDYTEPGFQISVRANDDRSQVILTLDVGSVKGGTDLINGMVLGGENNDIIDDIPHHGLPVYFKITGSNSAGTSVYVTCSLPTYDVTLPIGRMTADFTTTSNPRVIRGSLVAMEDSEIVSQNVGVGFGKDVYGDAVIEWYPFDLKPNEKELGDSDDSLAHFTGFKLGRVNANVISFTGVTGTAQECASKCHAMPTTKCMSFNYDLGTSGTCECLEAIEGSDNRRSEDGQFYHYERLGIGHAVEFDHQDMWLTHNNLYYINVQLINYIDYESIISTEGILFDETPPYPGSCPNAVEINEFVDCHTYIPFNREDWRYRCIDVSQEINNHRIIHDGENATTVFNGIEPLVDLKYTRANKFISVNWDGFHDDETGIHGYTWTIGLQLCEDLIHPHHDPQAHLYDETEWTHSGTLYPIPAPYETLPDNKYYTTIRALNKVEYGGPMSLSVCHTNLLGIDNTPPLFYEIYNFAYNETGLAASLDYNATDPESDVMFVDACMGQTSRDCYLVAWIAMNGDPKTLAFGVEIPDGILAWPKIKIGNHVLLTTIGVGEPIIVDVTPPIAGEIFDGPNFGFDLNYTKDSTEICASWSDFSDPESGIKKYELGLGTAPDLDDIIERQEYNGQTSSACFNTLNIANVSLAHATKYYFTVWAWNNAHKMQFVNVSSDGVLVDLTPPVEGELIDGNKDGFVDQIYSSKPATVEAQWRDYTDPESTVTDYEVQVGVAGNLSSHYSVVHAFESVMPDENILWHHFHLNHRDIVKSTLRTTNGALNSITTETDSFRVDLTAPHMTYLNDGVTPGVDINYSSGDDIAANWEFYDEESGVKDYNVAFFESYQGIVRPKLPAIKGQYIAKDKDSKTIEEKDQGLVNGARYFTETMVSNNADLSSNYKSDGFQLDKTAPIMQFVHVGVYSGSTEEVVDEHCWQQRTDAIIGSWKAIDGQSGIDSYSVAVGTSPGGTDVLDWTDKGNADQGIIKGLSLQLTNQSIMAPLYYVSVRAKNGGGLWSVSQSSEHGLIVVDEDQIGLAIDGPDQTDSNPYTSMGVVDINYKKDKATITVQFEGFESELHGLKRFEWAIGKTPHHEDVQPFMETGIILRNDETSQANIVGEGLVGAGKATANVDLEPNQWYYASIRATTYGDNVLECVTDGFVIDRTPPTITFDSVGILNGTVSLQEDHVVYETTVDSYIAEWHYSENTTQVSKAWYAVGTHPDGYDVSGIQNITSIQPNYFDHIANTLVQPALEGLPNILTVHAENNVGLASKVTSGSIVIDTTAPVEGTVTCPSQISAVTELQCIWSGFYEAQSKIVKYRFAIGSQEGWEDIYAYTDVDANKDRHMASNFLNPFEHKKKYYATVEATNSVGFKVWAYSDSITIDNTTPKYGVIVETTGISQLDWTRAMYGDEQSFMCTTEAECAEIDAVCQESLTQVAVAWTPFTDKETGVVRYELAVGDSPGGANIRQFFDVPVTSTNYLITDLDLNGVREVFVTLKGYNGAGLFSITTSNGVYLSYLSQGLQPLIPVEVWDYNDPYGDKDYQVDSEQLSARWDFSGEPCPIIKYYWAIYRMDNTELQEWTDVQANTFAQNDEMNMANGEGFYVKVKAINAIGMEFIMRSDGIIIQKDPLIPGRVNDGNVFGYDLMYWPHTNMVKANWDGFGVQTTATARSEVLSGNAGVQEEEDTSSKRNQDVDYYEVAIGTDRRYLKTRDNILPFTNVGKNKTVTIFDLDLVPRTAIYYITIRAHSNSLASVDVISNGFYVGFDSGVQSGTINLQDFWPRDDYLMMQWSGFTSEVEILFYNVGVSNTSDPGGYSCRHLTSKLITSEELATLFPVLFLSNVGKNTLAEVFNMTMEHSQTYYAFVIATDGTGECNMTMKHFTVDVTDPLEGALRTGPYWDMSVSYASTNIELEFFWEGYSDSESDLKEFQVALMYFPTCAIEDAVNATTLVDWITVPANYTSYKFLELDLQPSTPYYVHMRTVNKAGLMILTISKPILLDKSVPTTGDVIIGQDFMNPVVWNGADDQVYVNFLHLQTPYGTSCPDRPAPMFANDWYTIKTTGILTPTGTPWDIEYRSSEVTRENNDTIVITMTRDTKDSLIYSGAYSRNADFTNGGNYQIDIKAADGDHTATSIVFFDGPDGVIGDVNYVEETHWTLENCACCYEDPIPVNCVCDCTAYLEDQRYNQEVEASLNFTSTEGPTAEPYTGDVTTPFGTSAPVPWVIVADKKPGQVTYEAWETQPAYASCGMSLHSTGTRHYAVGWCRYANDTQRLQSAKNDLPFDPREWHTYRVEFTKETDDPSKSNWCLNVYGDDFNIVELCGIDEMSLDTKIILHVWNANNHIPALGDAFTAFSTAARFKAARIPPSSSLECRYGTPFRGGTNSIIQYEAAVGTSKGSEDIMAYNQAYVPCVPCNQLCDLYFCNDTCNSTSTENILISITNISMPMIRNDVNDTGYILAYNKSLPYFVSLKAVLGSGSSVIASSTGFYVDLTPPVKEMDVIYVDNSIDPFVPVQYQASNTTIKAIFMCDDKESMIKEYEWAIGSAPNITDLQNFTSTGIYPVGKNDQLGGFIEHNSTYYVTVRCTNNAGRSSLIVDPVGVTAILEPPNVDDVNSTIPGAEPFEHAVYPESAKKSTNPSKAGVTWTKSADPSINRYEYCLGSSNETFDDIFPCTWVGYNTSGEVEIMNGKLYIDGIAVANLSSYIVPNSDTNLTETMASPSDAFTMEPGRTLFTTMRICNLAEVCEYKFVATVTVVDDGAQLETSTNGEAITASLSAAKKRKKRSTTSRTVSITTPSGMSSGQSIIMGALSDADLAGNFSSGSSVDFSPFVVNPDSTKDMTERLLMNRINSMPDDSFYLAPLAHEALPDALEVTVSYYSDQMTSDNMPMLLHWDPDSTSWMISNTTCSISVSDRHVLDSNNLQFTTKICRTRSSNSTTTTTRRRRRRRRRRSTSSDEYFSEETQFVVATVAIDPVNTAPNITSTLAVHMQEDAGTLSYQLAAIDAESDSVLWAIDTSKTWTWTGNGTMSSSGVFSYRPCTDCYGVDVVPIMVYEDRSDDVTALYTYANITITVTSTKDSPEMFLAHFGYDIYPTSSTNKEITITVEQNTPENIAYGPWIGLVGAYDRDSADSLTISIFSASNGVVQLTGDMTTRPSLPTACSTDAVAEALPCNVTLDHTESQYAWMLMTLVYTPNSQFYGMDEFRIIIEDSGGKYSDVLSVTVAVLQNPCQSNSTCTGTTDDPDCTATKRATIGFLNEYSCTCLPSWVGTYCATDFDECASAPCQYPYACYDKFNGYDCACPPDWLICDTGLTPLMVGMIGIMFILICTLIGFIVWYRRSKLHKIAKGGSNKAYYNLESNKKQHSKDGDKNKNIFADPLWTTETIPGEVNDEEELSCPPTSSSMYNDRDNTPIPRISRPDSVMGGKHEDDPNTRLRRPWRGVVHKIPKVPLPWGLNIKKLMSSKTGSYIPEDGTDSTQSSSAQSIYDDNGPHPPPKVSLPDVPVLDSSAANGPHPAPMVRYLGGAKGLQTNQLPLTTASMSDLRNNTTRPGNSGVVTSTVTFKAPAPSHGSSLKTAWGNGNETPPATYEAPTSDLSQW